MPTTVSRQRRAEKRALQKAARAAEREAQILCDKERRAGEREAEKLARQAAKEAAKRPRGRPRKLPPRPARWTVYSPEHPRRIYHAIIRGDCFSDDRSVADFFDMCSVTVKNWQERHPAFARAIMRGYEDRAAIRTMILSCRVDSYDLTKINPNAKTDRGRFGKVIADAKPSFDHDRHGGLVADGHLHAVMRRRWRDRPHPPEHRLDTLPRYARRAYGQETTRSRYVAMAVGAVEDGARSNRQLATGLHVAESTVRYWRRRYPEFEAAIQDALDRP